MDIIHICNWLLTRRCNLDCDYCAIVKDYDGKPDEYPDMYHYIHHEMNLKFILESLKKLHNHNPNMFHIFYGGEPFLREDLSDIINYCNFHNIHYTIISNCTPQVQRILFGHFINNVEYIQGFTASVDPVDADSKSNSISLKTNFGKDTLIKLKGIVKDLVAEITVTRENMYNLYNLVVELSSHGITSDITFIDIAKNPYYDFSNVTNPKLLLNSKEDQDLREIIKGLIENKNLLIHMRELLPTIFKFVSADYNCKLEDNLNNITVDSDGSMRNCLRIKGTEAPKLLLTESFDLDGNINPKLKEYLTKDKLKYCELCNWPCVMMSNLISQSPNMFGTKRLKIASLIHKEKRSK